ncbi:hypothetical protein AMK59_3409 [Oryctes borbonicus]|uniref:Uncharacterized protein n=1 Tax=Oryctes borbonicus TaxID=1629725 RepID=A0A0T6B923_9SCAR|nr:hypothetical protein AMK59_3409 [Oryctes borbonicus]
MADLKSKYSFEICEEHSIESEGYDGVVFISSNGQEVKSEKLSNPISQFVRLDPTLKSDIAVLPVPEIPAKRLVYAPTGPLDDDYDDVRSLKETATKAIRRALKAGIKRPLVTLEENVKFPKSELVALLGILEGLYVVSKNIGVIF